MMEDKNYRILFVCSGNTCRSPMAEAAANHLLSGVEARSAGLATYAGMPASPHSQQAMAEIGIDIRNHRSQLVSRELLEWADWVLTMTETHKKVLLQHAPEYKDKIFTLGEYCGDPVEIRDPFGLSLDAYRLCRDQILADIQKIRLE